MKAEGSRLFGLEEWTGLGRLYRTDTATVGSLAATPSEGWMNGVGVHFYKSSFWLLCGESTTGGKSGSQVTSQEVMCRQDGWRPGPGR